MSVTSSHYAIAEDEAAAFWFLGNLATVKAGGEQTGGALAVVEFLCPTGFATPRHVHHAEDEAFYVLEGSLAGFCGEAKWEAVAGSFVWLPKDVPHGYANTANGVTRSLTITLPAGFEQFVAEVGEPATSRTLPPPSEPDIERAMAASARHQARSSDRPAPGDIAGLRADGLPTDTPRAPAGSPFSLASTCHSARLPRTNRSSFGLYPRGAMTFVDPIGRAKAA